MNRILPYVLISCYFFSFLIKEWNFNILAYDRLYPQVLFISLINFLSLLFIIHNRLMKDLIKKSFSNKLILAYFIFLIFCLISFVSSINISESVIVLTSFTTFFIAFVFIYFLSLHIDKNFINFCLILFVSASFFESLSVILSAYDVKYIQNLNVERSLVVRGFAANINISAFSIVYKLPFLMYILYKFESKPLKYLSLALLLFSFSALFILLSRGAFIAMSVSVISFMLIKFRKNTISKTIILLAIILISSVGVQNTFLNDNKSQIVDRVSSISLERSDDSVNERLSYYSHALESIKKNPILGIGIGNWKIKSIEYASKIMKAYTVPYHAHNDFLQIGAEIGLIGLIFYAFIVVYPILICINQILKKEYNDIYIIVLLVLISYFIDSMLNFPMSRPITHMAFIFVLILFSHIHKSIRL